MRYSVYVHIEIIIVKKTLRGIARVLVLTSEPFYSDV